MNDRMSDMDGLVEKACIAWAQAGGVTYSTVGEPFKDSWRQSARAALLAVGLPTLLERVEAAEGDAKVWPDDYGWADLMTLLDEHWPGDIFGDTNTPINALRGELAHDAGVRIVALLRWVDAIAAKVAAVEALLIGAVLVDADALRAALDASETP